ncbi:MAG TPA: hypothetical protein V6D22_08545 [Candidatus Obscuribacterales bacterium]
MSDQPPAESKSARCDGKDHGVTPERLSELRSEADAFNRLLQASKFDAPRVEDQQSNENRAFNASKAFYEQLTQLPIGERKALASLAQEQNQTMHAQDDGMPELKIEIDSHAFIDDVTVKYPWIRARDIRTNEMGYAREYFTFHYRGMCAEFEQPTRAPLVPSQNTFSFSLDNWKGIRFFGRH